MDNNKRKGFLSMNVGTVEYGNQRIPYVLHAEGIVTHDGSYRVGKEGKPSVLNLSVAVGRNPWLMLGGEEAGRQVNNADINENCPFVTLILSGWMADQMEKKARKGTKVVFCGRPEKNTYKKKNGTDAASVRVYVDNIYWLSTRSVAGEQPRNWVSRGVCVYESKGRENKSAFGMVSGKVVHGGSLHTIPSGRQVASATMELPMPTWEALAQINGTYDKNTDYGSTRIVSVSVWGARAAHMDRILVPGNTLVVTGTMRVRDGMDGRQFINMDVQGLSVLNWANTAGTEAAESAGDTPAANNDVVTPPSHLNTGSDDTPEDESIYEDDPDLPF